MCLLRRILETIARYILADGISADSKPPHIQNNNIKHYTSNKTLILHIKLGIHILLIKNSEIKYK